MDFTYFFTKNLAAELILTYPQKLDVQVNGVGKIGKNSYINFDIKKTYIRADLLVGGTKVSKLTLDPVLIGIGYGFRF